MNSRTIACGALVVGLLAVGTSAQARDPGQPGAWDNRCWGEWVTIRGTPTSDDIQGTSGRDVIFAYAGNDTIAAGDGRDVICGRWGNDIINAGSGSDRTDGGGDHDLCLFSERVRKC